MKHSKLCILCTEVVVLPLDLSQLQALLQCGNVNAKHNSNKAVTMFITHV